ncbi:hypothetical protein Tco_0910896, partial [Tanacetum coccineum]
YTGVDIPLFPTMIVQGPIVQGEGSIVLVESHHTPTNEAASTGVDVRYGGVATTVTGLEVGQGSGNIDKTPTMPHDSPLLRVNTLGSDEGSMTLQELMVFYITLSKKMESLETDLKQTKKIYGAAYTRLIKKVKKLEKIAKSSQARRRARIVISNDEDDLEDPSKQGRKIAKIDPDPGISLEATTASVVVSTVSPTRNTGVSTADDITMAGTMVYIRQSAIKEKAAMRLKAELKEEERQRIVKRLQAEEREKYTEAEQARMLSELINQRKRYFVAQRVEEKRNKPPIQAKHWTYMSNYIKNMGGYTLQQLRDYSFDEIKTLFEPTMRKVNTFVPIESEVNKAVPELAAGSSKRDAEEELDQESSKRQKTSESSKLAEEPRDKEADELSQEELQQMMIIVPEQGMNSLVKEKFNSTEPTNDKEREIWVELKRLFEPDTDDELWKLQKHITSLTWKLYDSYGVHHVSIEKGIDIYMLVEKEYPLSRGTLTLMLVAKLLVDQDNEMSYQV